MNLQTITSDLPFVGCGESRIGGRSENQDSYGFHDTPWGLLVTVCDGMGGGPGGKTASSIAVMHIVDGVADADKSNKPIEVLHEAIRGANMAVIKAQEVNPSLKGMGTTCTALLINNNSAIVAHVGDSRVYQLRGCHKVFRTFDHSMVFEMVKKGLITEEQARLSDNSNIITRALGIKQDVKIDISELPFEKNDRFVLCSDGIHGTMPEYELVKRCGSRKKLNQIVDGLADYVDQLGKKQGGGHDNLTVAIIETKVKSKLKEKMSTRNKIILMGSAVLLAASCALNIAQCSMNKKLNKTILEQKKNIEEPHPVDSIQTNYSESAAN